MDPKGKRMVINHKEKETLYIDEPKGDKPTDLGSNNKNKDGKKKRRIKKIIYYDSGASSSSPRDDDDEDSSTKKKTVCWREKSPAGWRSAPALNPKMRKGLKRFSCPAKQ
jgi:hypothetical protein